MKPNAANHGIYRVREHRAGGSGPEMFLRGAKKRNAAWKAAKASPELIIFSVQSAAARCGLHRALGFVACLERCLDDGEPGRLFGERPPEKPLIFRHADDLATLAR
jgi:hypothetical protein